MTVVFGDVHVHVDAWMLALVAGFRCVYKCVQAYCDSDIGYEVKIGE